MGLEQIEDLGVLALYLEPAVIAIGLFDISCLRDAVECR
jgi:hypothetical protein